MLLASLLAAAASAAEPRRPNIVFFLVDDMGWQETSVPFHRETTALNRRYRTPNMQRLVAEGMMLTRAFIASPACAPSRTAMHTGLMPARNGAEANHTFKRQGIRSLPENLVTLGYDVAAFGKVAPGEDVVRHGFTHHDKRYAAGVVEQYLDARDGTKPLCLFVGTRDPHVRRGRALAIERAARLGADLKGMGYCGIHIAGVHRGFELVGRILDRMAQIKDQWRDFLDDFTPSQTKNGCPGRKKEHPGSSVCSPSAHLSFTDRIHFRFLKVVHNQFFNSDAL